MIGSLALLLIRPSVVPGWVTKAWTCTLEEYKTKTRTKATTGRVTATFRPTPFQLKATIAGFGVMQEIDFVGDSLVFLKWMKGQPDSYTVVYWCIISAASLPEFTSSLLFHAEVLTHRILGSCCETDVCIDGMKEHTVV